MKKHPTLAKRKLVKRKRMKVKAKSRSQSWLDQVEIDSMLLMASSSGDVCGPICTSCKNTYISSVGTMCSIWQGAINNCWATLTGTELNNCISMWNTSKTNALNSLQVAWRNCFAGSHMIMSSDGMNGEVFTCSCSQPSSPC